MPQPRATYVGIIGRSCRQIRQSAASGDAVTAPVIRSVGIAPGANGAAIPGSSKSRTRMTAPISRDALRNMSGGRPAAAPGANVPSVQTPAQRAQSDAFDPTVTVPLLGTDGTSVDQLPPMAQIMPPSFAPQQVHDVNAANVGRNIEEDLPDQPLWGQLKIKVIAIVVALVLLVVGLVAAWFILNGATTVADPTIRIGRTRPTSITSRSATRPHRTPRQRTLRHNPTSCTSAFCRRRRSSHRRPFYSRVGGVFHRTR